MKLGVLAAMAAASWAVRQLGVKGVAVGDGLVHCGHNVIWRGQIGFAKMETEYTFHTKGHICQLRDLGRVAHRPGWEPEKGRSLGHRQECSGDGVPLLRQTGLGFRLVGPTIPVAGVGWIALFAVQIGVYPGGAVAIRLVLQCVVSAVPILFAVQPKSQRGAARLAGGADWARVDLKSARFMVGFLCGDWELGIGGQGIGCGSSQSLVPSPRISTATTTQPTQPAAP